MSFQLFRRAAPGALLLAAALAGCKPQGGHLEAASSGFCTPFPTAQSGQAPAATANDPSAALEDCIHGWSYALAPSRDGADLVAQAAVEACESRLSQWNQQALAQPEADQQAPSLTNGQPTDPMASHAQYAQSRALFYVVQARAAHCAPPTASAVPPVGPRGG